MRQEIGIGLRLHAHCGLLSRHVGLAPTPSFAVYSSAFSPRAVLACLVEWLAVEAAIRPPVPTARPDCRRVGLGFARSLGRVAGLCLVGSLAARLLLVLAPSWAAEPPAPAAVALGTTPPTSLPFERCWHIFLPRGLPF